MQARTWKLLGIAGVAGVTATGVVVARRKRQHREHDPQELRAKLHARLAEVPRDGDPAPAGGEGGQAERPGP